MTSCSFRGCTWGKGHSGPHEVVCRSCRKVRLVGSLNQLRTYFKTDAEYEGFPCPSDETIREWTPVHSPDGSWAAGCCRLGENMAWKLRLDEIFAPTPLERLAAAGRERS